MDSNKSEENVISQINDSKQTSTLNDLSGFVYKRTLNSNSNTKVIVIEGSFGVESSTALAILEKEPFEENLRKIFQQEDEVKKSFQNDVYHSFRYLPRSDFNGIKTTVIYPATEKHIQKYECQNVHIIEETPDLYVGVTLPFLESEQFSVQWVYNILEHKAETERIVFEDTDPEVGFILLPDLKWDGSTIESLHLQALPFKRGIMSLRDLTQKELPLLKNIYEKGIKAITDTYSVPTSQLRVYFHYQPSYYHIHVHFTHLKYLAPGIGTERAHLITTVINNLELMSDYYKISKLHFMVSENDKLFDKYEALGLVRRLPRKIAAEDDRMHVGGNKTSAEVLPRVSSIQREHHL